MARLLTYIASSRDMKILTSFEAGKALAAFLLLVVSPIVASGQQVSILNPTDLIPGFGGDDEKDVRLAVSPKYYPALCIQ